MMLEKFVPVMWIVGIGLSYGSLALFLSGMIECMKRRAWTGAVLYIAALVPGVLVYRTAPVPVVRFLEVSAVSCACMVITYRMLCRTKQYKERKKVTRSVTLHLVLITGAAIFIMPFIWLLLTSLKEEDQIFKYPPVWLPTRPVQASLDGKMCKLGELEYLGRKVRVAVLGEVDAGKRVRILEPRSLAGKTIVVTGSRIEYVRRFGLKWENYSKALEYMPPETHKGFLYLWNTVCVTVLSIVGTILSSSLVAYSFARLRWFGRDVLFGVMLATMMIPGVVTMIPVFLIFRSMGWVDTLMPLWVPAFFGGPFVVFLMRQFFLTIPGELQDAASIDGCGYFDTYRLVMLPLVKPALAAITIMTFIGSWNNFMGPLIYINSPEKMTLAYGLQLFMSTNGTEYGLLMAASTLVMLPVLVTFFCAQKYFIEGITLTGLNK